MDNVQTDEYWQNKLTAKQYHVLREKGTDPPFTGKYVHEHADGDYYCAACGARLFTSDTKFDSGSGWPSFSKPADTEKVILSEDKSLGMTRTEVSCAQCGSHLGHLFMDGPKAAGGARFCLNSTSLKFTPESQA